MTNKTFRNQTTLPPKSKFKGILFAKIKEFHCFLKKIKEYLWTLQQALPVIEYKPTNLFKYIKIEFIMAFSEKTFTATWLILTPFIVMIQENAGVWAISAVWRL